MGPYEQAIFDRTYRWGKTIQSSPNSSPKEMRHSTTKSEAWLFAMCSGDCPTNCTGFGGDASVWGYVNKSVNPFLRDRVKEDPKLKVMCKGKPIFTIMACI